MRIVLFWIATAVALVSTYASLGYLEKFHRQIWERLGSPWPVFDNYSSRYFAFLEFFYSGDLFRIGDWRLTVIGVIAMGSTLVSVVLFFLFLIT